MSIENMFKVIETMDFEADLAIASGSNLLILILDKHKLVEQLIHELEVGNKNIDLVVDRIYQLLNTEVTADYRHPYDSAILAYLYGLGKIDPYIAFKVAERVLNTKQTYRAHWFAKYIRDTFDINQITTSNEP